MTEQRTGRLCEECGRIHYNGDPGHCLGVEDDQYDAPPPPWPTRIFSDPDAVFLRWPAPTSERIDHE